MNNDRLMGNKNCIDKHLKHWANNSIYLILKVFHNIKTIQPPTV